MCQNILLLSILFTSSSCFPLQSKGKLKFTPKVIIQQNVETEEPEEPTPRPRPQIPPEIEDEPELVKFETLKEQILVPYCIECHKSFANEQRILRDVVPGDPEMSLLYQVVKDGSMPEDRAPLTSKELEVVQKYIESISKDEY